jgi:hypothetical protein
MLAIARSTASILAAVSVLVSIFGASTRARSICTSVCGAAAAGEVVAGSAVVAGVVDVASVSLRLLMTGSPFVVDE